MPSKKEAVTELDILIMALKLDKPKLEYFLDKITKNNLSFEQMKELVLSMSS